jgi:SAM-dependent methyltransferase
MSAWLKPVEPEWGPVLERALGRAVALEALAVMVARQSRRYLGEDVALAPADGLAARTLFWFPRDVLKVARAVGELAWADALPNRPLRVLDLGAGVGATSLGALRALPASARVASVTAVDHDPAALAILRRVADGARGAGLLPASTPAVSTAVVDLAAPGWGDALGLHDLVLAGLTAVEFTRAYGDEVARGAAVAAFLREALRRVADDGALVVIEPGSRAESRALHVARSILLAEGATVFAPCLHAAECPMLRRPRDWCHEDLADVALPPWLQGVAKAAGLRWEGLTWSYLVLRRDGRTLRGAMPAATPMRMVSLPAVTKGKTEAWWCGPLTGARGDLRVVELDRVARGATGTRLRDVARGALIALEEDGVAEAGSEGKALRLDPARWRPVWP